MRRFIYLLPLLILTSCATIMHGRMQTMGISSNPSYAQVWIDRQYIGETPLTVKLNRNSHHYIRIELEGYHPYEIVCTKQLSGWVFGNIFFGGVVGFCVDALTGAIYRLTPEQVHAQLSIQNLSPSVKEDSSYFGIVLQPKKNWEKVGQLERNTL